MRRRGFSIIELLIALAIIGILLSVAIPIFRTAHSGASETAVMREVKTIHEAQVQYLSQFGEYAASLAQLGPPQNGISGPQAAKLIPASLASGEKNGYRFSLERTKTGFAVSAIPESYPKDGRRTFYIDEDGIVRQNWGPEPATVDSPEMK